MTTTTHLPSVHINGHTFQPRDDIHRRKLEALRVFVQHLLASPARHQIAKIILFGSVAKGEAKKDSDVDVMVFGFGDLETIRDHVYDAALESGIEWGEGIEPMVDSSYEILEPTSYFTYRVTRHGQEAYSMYPDELKRLEIRELRKLAQEYLASAEDAFAHDHLRLAADGAYNAAELCIKGLLHLKLDDIPGSHGGLVDKFGELYCKSGPLSRELGRRVNQGLEIRSHARYRHDVTITPEKAQHNLTLAREMLTHLETALSG